MQLLHARQLGPLTRQDLSCIFRPRACSLRYQTAFERVCQSQRLGTRLAPSSRRFASRIGSRPHDHPDTVGSLPPAESDDMSGWGLKGYAQWGLAMFTSLPIWAGGGAVVLFQFVKKCGPPAPPTSTARAAPCRYHYGILSVLRLFGTDRSPAGLTAHPAAPSADRHHAALLCRSPFGFFQVKDRSQMQFPDPFQGLQHETAEVNGVKCAAVVGSDPSAG